MEYYPEENRWKKKYELTIPILLLILVLAVLAWKMGWLAQIPGLGGLLGGQVTDVLVIGNDKNVQYSLDEVKKSTSLNYDIMTREDMNDLRDPAQLDKYEMFILTEEVGQQPGDLPALFRNYLSQRLGGGAKLIMYGVAGSRDPSNPSVDGWTQHGMGKYVPVTCPNIGPCTQNKTGPVTTNIASLKIKETDHPILNEFGLKSNFEGESISYSQINPVSGSNVLAQIEVETSGTTASPSIVEKSFGLGGKTIYFAYHPSKTPTILKNTIEYLK